MEHGQTTYLLPTELIADLSLQLSLSLPVALQQNHYNTIFGLGHRGKMPTLSQCPVDSWMSFFVLRHKHQQQRWVILCLSIHPSIARSSATVAGVNGS